VLFGDVSTELLILLFTTPYNLLASSLFESFQNCACDACGNDKGWLQLFGNMKGNQPHLELLKLCLCPKLDFPDFDAERPCFMNNWKCGQQICEECGVEKRLP